MPFRVVSEVGIEKGVLDGDPHPQGEGVSGFFLPIGLSDVFGCIFKAEMYSTRA